MKHLQAKILAAVMLLIFCVSAVSGCKGPNGDDLNETKPFVISSLDFDEVFNPFFATSGADTSVIDLTQLGMLASDDKGDLVAGENIASVALHYDVDTVDKRYDKTDDKDFDNWYTDYSFVIKNGLKFSDGSDLTMKDILFTMYVYLDPNYTGSATMYSTHITGLNAYRYQTEDINEQNNFQKIFNDLAEARISNIDNWTKNYTLSAAQQNQVDADRLILEDLFRKELEGDWGIAAGQIDSYEKYTIKDTTLPVDQTWQIFLILEGWASVDEQKKTVNLNGEDTFYNKLKGEGKTDAEIKEAFISKVFNDMVKNPEEGTLKKNIEKIINFYGTAITLRQALALDEQTKHFEESKTQDGELSIPKIEGITFTKDNKIVNSKGVEKSFSEQHDILKIRVDGIDPKAIYNFSFSVVPMSYYSSSSFKGHDLIAEANPAANKFGVAFGDSDFMDKVVGAKMVPMGAGPYKAESYEKRLFFYNNIARLERNEHFLLGPAKMRLVQFKVINANKLFDAVANGEVVYADPSAQKETILNLQGKYKDKLGYATVDNLGYGYIGINARFVPDIEVRRAIMSTLNPELCLEYYTNDLASVVYRPMSKHSWAYPKDCGPYEFYPGVSYDPTGETAKELIESAGWANVNGTYQKLDKQNKIVQLKYTFTIAGDSENHPAAATLNKSMDILNKIGCKITIAKDPQALSKLSSGLLTVWAAAWSSTIDPDMYQVYHKDSSATSVKNWGYPHMLGPDGDSRERLIISELSTVIEDARKTDDREYRTRKYSEALDLVMDLAVEFPTYQRCNLFVWDKSVDENTLTKPATPYSGPINKIWEVSFK